MKPSDSELSEGIDIEVATACGGKMTLSDDTPRAAYDGGNIYFCLEECRVLFKEDPLNSCLADRVKSQTG